MYRSETLVSAGDLAIALASAIAAANLARQIQLLSSVDFPLHISSVRMELRCEILNHPPGTTSPADTLLRIWKPKRLLTALRIDRCDVAITVRSDAYGHVKVERIEFTPVRSDSSSLSTHLAGWWRWVQQFLTHGRWSSAGLDKRGGNRS
jgi:hypothetical protein